MAGELRPLFAHSHDLPATLRLCDRHMSVVSNARDSKEIDVVRPTAATAEQPNGEGGIA